MESIILIHNFRTDIVGCNQIKTVFDPNMRDTSILMGTIVLANIICDLRTLTQIVTVMMTVYNNNKYYCLN